jgi:hypothetical protein
MADTKEDSFGDAQIVGNKAVKKRKSDNSVSGKNMYMANKPTNKLEQREERASDGCSSN